MSETPIYDELARAARWPTLIRLRPVVATRPPVGVAATGKRGLLTPVPSGAHAASGDLAGR